MSSHKYTLVWKTHCSPWVCVSISVLWGDNYNSNSAGCGKDTNTSRRRDRDWNLSTANRRVHMEARERQANMQKKIIQPFEWERILMQLFISKLSQLGSVWGGIQLKIVEQSQVWYVLLCVAFKMWNHWSCCTQPQRGDSWTYMKHLWFSHSQASPMAYKVENTNSVKNEKNHRLQLDQSLSSLSHTAFTWNQTEGRGNMLFWTFILVLCVWMAMFPPYVFDCVTSGCEFHASGQEKVKKISLWKLLKVIFFFM